MFTNVSNVVEALLDAFGKAVKHDHNKKPAKEVFDRIKPKILREIQRQVEAAIPRVVGLLGNKSIKEEMKKGSSELASKYQGASITIDWMTLRVRAKYLETRIKDGGTEASATKAAKAHVQHKQTKASSPVRRLFSS